MAKIQSTREAPPDDLIEAAFVLVSKFTEGQTNPEMSALIAESYVGAAGQSFETLVAEFGIPLSEAAIPVSQAVIEWARENTAALVTQITETAQRGIAQTIAEGIWEQRDVPTTGRSVRGILEGIEANLGRTAGLDAQRAARVASLRSSLAEQGYEAARIESITKTFSAKMLKERSELIAQTEMRRAVSQARGIQEKQYGAKEKRWSTVGDNRVRDEHTANEAEGWIPIDNTFSSGHDETPGGPACRCTVQYRGMTREQLTAAIAAQQGA